MPNIQSLTLPRPLSAYEQGVSYTLYTMRNTYEIDRKVANALLVALSDRDNAPGFVHIPTATGSIHVALHQIVEIEADERRAKIFTEKAQAGRLAEVDQALYAAGLPAPTDTELVYFDQRQKAPNGQNGA